MIGLAGARVIVVDDQPKDAIPIMRALSSKGIPSAFFNGRYRLLPAPTERLRGVRLAILDMDIVGGGASVTDESKAAALVSYLEAIIASDNGPYAVLAWTNNPNIVQLFENYVFRSRRIQTPIFTVMVTKDSCKKKGRFDVDLVSAKVNEELTRVSPLLILQGWEGECFGAATNVTNALSGLADNGASALQQWRGCWKDQLLRLMHDMAKAEAESQLNADTCLVSMFGLLNPLHADRMESQSAELAKSLRGHAGEVLAASTGCSQESRARVNTMLHLSFDNLDRFTAGVVLKFNPAQRIPDWVPTMTELLNDLVEKKKHKTDESERKLRTFCRQVLVEVTPACDHAQDHIRIARFIAGLLVPAGELGKMKRKTAFIWELGPVFLDNGVRPGGYSFLFSARHMVSLDLEEAEGARVYARLRGQAFADLQAWLAGHAGRAGKALLAE